MNKPSFTELTVIEHLYHLPKEIKSLAIYNALLDDKYRFNLVYRTNNIKKALIQAFDFTHTKQGYEFWYRVWEDIGNAEVKKYDEYPQEVRQ